MKFECVNEVFSAAQFQLLAKVINIDDNISFGVLLEAIERNVHNFNRLDPSAMKSMFRVEIY